MALAWREALGIPQSRSEKALTASTSVLEAAQDRTLNLNSKLAVSRQVRAAWMQFQTAGYGYLYGHQPAVRSVVDYIATNVVELGPKLYQRKGDTDRVEKGDHAAAETLREPNPWTPGRQFIFDVFADFLVYNNAYVLKVKPSGSKRLYLLSVPASAVGVLGTGVSQLAGYQIFRVDGSNFTVPPEDVIHWRGYDASDRRVGISKLETLRAELAEQAATQRANVDLMESGLQQRGYIKRPLEAPDWRKDGGKDRFVEQFRAAMQKASRGYPVLEEGMEIAPLGVSPKDAEMLSSRTLFNDEVAAQYGMVHCPPEGEEERRQFYADVLPPLCSLFCDFLRLQYLQSEFMVDDMYFEFSIDKKQMSDNRLQALTSAAGVPPLLRNEARGMLNLPPVKGGDEPVTPANIQVGDPTKLPAPGALPPASKPSTGVMPIQDPNKPTQDGSHRTTDSTAKPVPSPPKALVVKNWVEEQGGLPSYIKRIKKHLERRGMTESHAIASAVNAAQRMCSTGDLNFPGAQQVNPGSRAEACAAIAEWNAMKARAHASSLDLEEDLMDPVYEDENGELYVSVKRYIERQHPRDPHTGQWIGTGGVPNPPDLPLLPHFEESPKGPRVPSAPSASQDLSWTHHEEGADPEWEVAGQAEAMWQRAPSPKTPPSWDRQPLVPEELGVNEPGQSGKIARQQMAEINQRRDEVNRQALAKRNPDMEVVVVKDAFELRPKKDAARMSKEELQKRNPDYQPPGDSLVHRIEHGAGSAFDWFFSPGAGDTTEMPPPSTSNPIWQEYQVGVGERPPRRRRRSSAVEWEHKRIEVTNTPRFKADVARQHRNVDEAVGVLEGFYGRQRRSLKKKALEGKAFDVKRWNRELAQDLVALFKSIIDREGGVYAGRLGADDFDMRQVENYIKATADKLAERINEATQRDVEEVGLGDALERASSERAAIAGSGIGTKATIFARQEAAKQAPHPERRTQVWIANTDRHKDLDGVVVRLDEDWGGISPGQEPNCMCTCVIE